MIRSQGYPTGAALISRFGAIWIVHVDQPNAAEIQERLAEMEQDLLGKTRGVPPSVD